MRARIMYARHGPPCSVCHRVIAVGRGYIGAYSDAEHAHIACVQRLINEAAPDYDDETVVLNEFKVLAEQARSGVDIFA